MNPFTIVLITGMAFSFLICAGLLYLLSRCIANFISNDESLREELHYARTLEPRNQTANRSDDRKDDNR